MNLTRGWLVAACIGAAAQAQAAPMGFADSWMAMADLGPNWSEVYVNYALTPRDALGMSVNLMKSDDGLLERELGEVTYTRLLKRWNMPRAQANVWFIGGIGGVRSDGATRLMATPGVQVDYETRRVYVAATARLFRARAINHDYGSVRAGFSFYETEYDQSQPWLIVEARRMRGLSERTEVTPLLRIIHRNYFVEAGYSNMHQARFNLMYIF